MQAEQNQAPGQSQVITFLIACGTIGPLLFIIVFVIEGATRPGYSAWKRTPASLLDNEKTYVII